MTENERERDLRDVLSGPVATASSAGGELSAITHRVVLGYAVAASSWIVVSDLAVGAYRGDPVGDRVGDLVKGIAFVAVTAVALWAVLRRVTRSYDRHFARVVTAQRDFYQSLVHTSTDVIVMLSLIHI